MESDFAAWVEREFRHPVPGEYRDFLFRDAASAHVEPVAPSRAYLVTADGDEYEVSEWFSAERIPDIYSCCRAEGLIAEQLLPIFDSCGCVAALDCDERSSTYGSVLLQTPEGHYDEARQENVYEEPVLLARSFSDVLAALGETQQGEAPDLLLLGSDRTLGPSDLASFERELDVELPADYREFLLAHNGGTPARFLCTPTFMEVDPATREGHRQSVPIDHFLSLGEISELLVDNEDEPTFGPGRVPVACDQCGNLILLDVACGSGASIEGVQGVQFANHEVRGADGLFALSPLASSFVEFVRSLAPYGEDS
uniref:SMI1/KNR4 family protein n=1 Tax=Olsenella timonensis TaxID=1805478 RepID=UPI00094EB895|nr:SMI1/KNR4 family protein [Olsenella timonensis]